MPFVTLAQAKAIMRIPASFTDRDEELQLYVDAANAHLYGIFGGLTDSVPTLYTDKITIDDVSTSAVFTRRWPVLPSPAPVLKQGGVQTDGDKFFVDDLGLIKLLPDFQAFEWGARKVEITYTAGFLATDPALAELRLAGAQLAAYNANIGAKGGLSRERIGQYEYELASGASGGSDGAGGFGIPPTVERILARWTCVMRGWPNAT